ncbi:MAG: ABC transporter substrate-binding protein [Chthoniobacteraceae bacterium]
MIIRPLLRAFAILAVFLTGCVEEPAPRLRIGSFQRPGFEPLFLARSLGYYDERRIQLVEFPTAAEMLLAWRNRAIDGATVTTDDVLRLAAEGQALRIVMVLNSSNGGDAVLARPELRDIAALKGRKVAVESNALGGYLLARALDTAGLTLADVKIVSARVDRVGLDLSIGNVDAVVAYEPHRTRIMRQGVAQIFDSSKIPGEISGVLIVPTPLADKPTAALRELTAGWFRALTFLRHNPADAGARLAAREGLAPEQFHEALELVKFATFADQRPALGSPDAPLLANMRRMADFMARAGMLASEADPAPLRSASLFPEPRR